MRFHPALVLSFVVIASAVAWLELSGPADAPIARGPVANADGAQHEPLPARAASDASPPAKKTAPPATGAAPVSPAPTESLASRVDRWSRSPDPADAMRAYETVFNCLQARRDDRRPSEEVALEHKNMEEALPEDQRAGFRRNLKTSAQLCGDLRSDQVQARLQWLGRAAQAGMPMAALDFIFEGPDGNGVLQDLTVPGAAPTQAWIDQRDAYVDAGLRHCDLTLMGYLGAKARGDSADIGQAISFWRAHMRCWDEPAPPSLMDDPVARRYLRDLVGAQGTS
jgi:hypothetical protein